MRSRRGIKKGRPSEVLIKKYLKEQEKIKNGSWKEQDGSWEDHQRIMRRSRRIMIRTSADHEKNKERRRPDAPSNFWSTDRNDLKVWNWLQDHVWNPIPKSAYDPLKGIILKGLPQEDVLNDKRHILKGQERELGRDLISFQYSFARSCL